MADLVHCLTNLLLFDIPLLYYYINLRSSIIFCLLSRDIYLSLCISLLTPVFSTYFVTVSELFCSEVLETFVISSSMLFPIKSPDSSAALRIAYFEIILSGSVADCLA